MPRLWLCLCLLLSPGLFFLSIFPGVKAISPHSSVRHRDRGLDDEAPPFIAMPSRASPLETVYEEQYQAMIELDSSMGRSTDRSTARSTFREGAATAEELARRERLRAGALHLGRSAISANRPVSSASSSSSSWVLPGGGTMSRAQAIQFFYSLDLSEEGAVSKEEFAKFFLAQGLSQADIDLFWKQLDINKSGTVTIAEWLKFFFPGGDASPMVSGEELASVSTGEVEIIFDAKANGERHNTWQFTTYQVTKKNKLVVRRGASFYVKVIAPKKLSTQHVFRSLNFTIGKHQAPNAGTKHCTNTTWCTEYLNMSIHADNQGRYTATMSVYIPLNAPIGMYSFFVAGEGIKLHSPGTIMVLFNPWHVNDTTYYDDTDLLKEYIAEDDGNMFYGDVLDVGLKGISKMAWNFHQYEVLDVVLDLLQSTLSEKELEDPIPVSRALSWMLNNAGNPKGVLAGRWDGKYSDGHRPTSWTGSRQIYDEYRSTKKTVKYGQCWVFSGLMVSALRAIGVPARSISNFRSAHDTPPYDLVIDRTTGDSIWNYHLWAEGWMKRPDLKDKLSKVGTKSEYVWNAVDATPQEQSGNKYAMGPAAVPLVKADDRNASFDTLFVIAETNALVWLGHGKYNPNTTSGADIDSQDVGKFMSTKRPGCSHEPSADCRADVTNTYKVAHKAKTWPRFTEIDPTRISASNPKKKHTFRAVIEPTRPRAGDDLKLTFYRENLFLFEPADVVVLIKADAITYGGKYVGPIKKVKGRCIMTPEPDDPRNTCHDAEGGLSLVLKVSNYLNYLKRTSHIRLVAVIHDAANATTLSHREAWKTNVRQFVWEETFWLKLPTLHVAIHPEHVETGRPWAATISVKNPLPVPITNVTLHLDSPDYDKTAVFPGATISPYSTAELMTEPLKATMIGERPLLISLMCNEITGSRGHAQVDVKANTIDVEENRRAMDMGIVIDTFSPYTSSDATASAFKSSGD